MTELGHDHRALALSAQGTLAFRPKVHHAIAKHGEGGFGVLRAVAWSGRVRVGDRVRIVKG